MNDNPYDWGEDDSALQDHTRKVEEARQKRAHAYFNVFTSKEGGKILEEWVTRFCTGTVPDASASVRECAMRDGKQQMVKEIIDQITIATTPRE